jgi:CheY-like chemotaxis protein
MPRETDPELIKKLRTESSELKQKLDALDARLQTTIAGKKPSQPHIEPLEGFERATRSRKVLIVDDDEEVLEVLTRMVSRLGHSVATATSSRAALIELADYQPDVAIVDLGLPDLDGFGLARKLRSDLGDRCPLLVALTAQEGESVRAEALAAGFHRFYSKPLPIQELILLIQISPRSGAAPSAGSKD